MAKPSRAFQSMLTTPSLPVEDSRTTSELIFQDSKLYEMKFPKMTVQTGASDEDIKRAVLLVYAGSEKSETVYEVIKLLCSLAYTELRDPQNPDNRVFSDPQYYEHNPKQVPILEDLSKPEFSLLGLYQDRPANEADRQQTTMTDELAALYNRLVVKGADGKPDHTGLFDKEPKLPEKLTRNERVYIGAWAYYHLRCFVKNSTSMIGYQKSTDATTTAVNQNRMQVLIQKLYSISLPEDILPPLSPVAYDRLHNAMSKGDPYVLGMLVRSSTLFYHYREKADMESKRKLELLRGLWLMMVLEHSLTAYVWTQNTANKLDFMPPPLLLANVTKDRVTAASALKVRNFYYRYVYSAETYKSLPASVQAEIGPYIGGKYFQISRLLNSDFSSSVGRINNLPLLACLKEIQEQLFGVGNLKNFVLDETDATVKAGIDVGRRFAAIYKQDLQAAPESEYLTRKPAANTVVKMNVDVSDLEDGYVPYA